jgi:hypothetical protein
MLAVNTPGLSHKGKGICARHWSIVVATHIPELNGHRICGGYARGSDGDVGSRTVAGGLGHCQQSAAC